MAPDQVVFAGAAVLILILLYALRQEEAVAKYLLVCWGVVCFLYAFFLLTQPTLAGREIEGGFAFALGALACGLAFALERLDRRRSRQRRGLKRRQGKGEDL
jgi:hypothetical protein